MTPSVSTPSIVSPSCRHLYLGASAHAYEPIQTKQRVALREREYNVQRRVLCGQCSEEVRTRDMAEHLRSACARRLVACPNFGCDQRYELCMRKAHEAPGGGCAGAAAYARLASAGQRKQRALLTCELGPDDDDDDDDDTSDDGDDNNVADDDNVDNSRHQGEGEVGAAAGGGGNGGAAGGGAMAVRRQRQQRQRQRRRRRRVCGKRMPAKALRAHQRSRCPFRRVPCVEAAKGCTARVCHSLMAQHVASDACVVGRRRRALARKSQQKRSGRRLPCPLGCGQQLVQRALAAHTRDACRHRLVPCRNAGCEQQVRVVDWPAHDRSGECDGGSSAARDRVLRSAAIHASDRVPCDLARTLGGDPFGLASSSSSLSTAPPQGCGALVLARHLDKHKATECPNRLLPCGHRGCKRRIHANELAVHMRLCPVSRLREVYADRHRERQQTKPCPQGCGEDVTLGGQWKHMRGPCTNRPQRCPNIGCDAMVQPSDRQEHYRHTCQIARRRARLVWERKAATIAATCTHGCPAPLNLKGKRAHEEDCGWRPIPCDAEGCGILVMLMDYVAHRKGQPQVVSREEVGEVTPEVAAAVAEAQRQQQQQQLGSGLSAGGSVSSSGSGGSSSYSGTTASYSLSASGSRAGSVASGLGRLSGSMSGLGGVGGSSSVASSAAGGLTGLLGSSSVLSTGNASSLSAGPSVSSLASGGSGGGGGGSSGGGGSVAGIVIPGLPPSSLGARCTDLYGGGSGGEGSGGESGTDSGGESGGEGSVSGGDGEGSGETVFVEGGYMYRTLVRHIPRCLALPPLEPSEPDEEEEEEVVEPEPLLPQLPISRYIQRARRNTAFSRNW